MLKNENTKLKSEKLNSDNQISALNILAMELGQKFIQIRNKITLFEAQ